MKIPMTIRMEFNDADKIIKLSKKYNMSRSKLVRNMVGYVCELMDDDEDTFITEWLSE